MSYTLDKDLKLDIFTQVSDFMKTKKTLTNDVLDKIVTKSFRKVKADVEHIPAFIEAFKPYQLAFSIPEELMERVPRYVPSAQDADILRKINVE
jgi:hypothetical protein